MKLGWYRGEGSTGQADSVDFHVHINLNFQIHLNLNNLFCSDI